MCLHLPFWNHSFYDPTLPDIGNRDLSPATRDSRLREKIGYTFRRQHGDPPMTDSLLRFRAEFPILERTTYMISNSLGAMPRGVYDSTRDYCDIWATRGVRAW